MPAPRPPMPLEEAKTLTTDILSSLFHSDHPAFSSYASSPTLKLVSAQRLDKAGKEATEAQVQSGKFYGRMLFRMQATEEMMNAVGSMHGGCVATIIDNLSSMVICLHIADTQPTTPWAFLGLSQSLSIVYFAAVPADEWIELEANVASIGGRIAVVTADMWLIEGEDGGRVRKTASGTHTKVDNSQAGKL